MRQLITEMDLKGPNPSTEEYMFPSVVVVSTRDTGESGESRYETQVSNSFGLLLRLYGQRGEFMSSTHLNAVNKLRSSGYKTVGTLLLRAYVPEALPKTVVLQV